MFHHRHLLFDSVFFNFILSKKSGNVIPDSTFLFTFSCDEMDWCSFKDKGLADLIFQETKVRKVHEFFFINKDDKGWWFGCHLGRIENLKAFSFVCRCWIDSNGIHDDIVQDS